VKILITTLGRPHAQVTLANLPERLREVTTLVCQAHEVAVHARLYSDRCAGIVELPEDIDNLGATRQYILDELRGQKYVLLDDDLTFYVRSVRTDWRLRMPTDEDMLDLFHEIDWKLDDYAHVGVSGREGNNREERYGVECVRYMRVLAYNTAMFPADVRADHINGMSDFDVNLQLLRRGLPSYVFFRYAQGQSMTQAEGGCAINRTHETHNAEVDWMVAANPGLVRRTEKKNKTGGDFGTRAEVIVAWKRALDYGVANPAHDPEEADDDDDGLARSSSAGAVGEQEQGERDHGE
jgi:hypothetical protein